ncbi:hypothetical protein BGZ72_009185 [Mortierella alpina]|nr:hypothetical protein BGZ72_009185 [Mortierella alpina]
MAKAAEKMAQSKRTVSQNNEAITSTSTMTIPTWDNTSPIVKEGIEWSPTATSTSTSNKYNSSIHHSSSRPLWQSGIMF